MKSRLLLFLFCLPSWTYAMPWHDLWLNAEQRAAQLMKNKQYQAAAKRFKRADWQAAAYYRAGDYAKAASLFEGLQTPLGFYNAGNAYARLGQFEKALKAYDHALNMDSNDQDARFNRDLVKQWLDQQKKQEKQTQQDKQQQSQSASNPSADQQSGTDNQSNQADSNASPQEKAQENKSKVEQSASQNDTEKKKLSSQSHEKDQKSQAEQANQSKSQDAQEKQQAKAQWLRLIPEPPSNLLKEKFLRDYLKDTQEQSS